MNKIPYDLNILKNFNQLGQLEDNFFKYEMRKKIWNLFSKKILTSKWNKDIEYELFLNSLFFANQYVTSFIAIAKNIDSLDKNHQLEFSNKIFSNLYNFNKNYKFDFNFIFKQKNYYSNIKRIIRNISFKSFRSIGATNITIIDHNKYALEWIYSNKKKYNFIYRPSNKLEEFMKHNNIIKNTLQKSNVIDFYLNIIQEISKDLNINQSINNNLLDFCAEFLKNLLGHILFITNSLDNKTIPKTIISNIGGFLNSRIISNRCLLLGGEVLRFTHGSGIIKGNQNSFKMNELCLTSKYYLNNNNEVNFGKNIYKQDNIFIKKKIDFDCYNQNKEILKKNITLNKANQLKYIYSVSNFEFYRFPGPATLHDLDYLKFQNKIIDFLVKSKINFIYQPHPETTIDIKKNPAEKFNILKTNFEKSLFINDIFIFDKTLSTTFWKAVYFKKPIILIKLFNVDDANPYNIRIDKRCSILNIKNLKDLDNYLDKSTILNLTEEAVVKSQIKDNFDLIF